MRGVDHGVRAHGSDAQGIQGVRFAVGRMAMLGVLIRAGRLIIVPT